MKRIIVKNVNKQFRLGAVKSDTALARLVSARQIQKIQVARGISFDADAGEIIGVIGRNGSGKSTLLRLIAQIYQKDSGEVRTEGNLIYLSGYGQGLQPKLTMKENIYLMGAVMGLSSADVRRRFDEIVDFSGLREFVNTKVYQFSSGMVVRLNFSVTIFCIAHHDPDILLLDEVLGSGGDLDFQVQALLKIEEFIKGGATVILVSHSLETIQKYCHRVIWLEKGSICKIGTPAEVVAAYAGASDVSRLDE
jgi:ABC-type polysaccharide/polyol phosphate transport system ATPase subunit